MTFARPSAAPDWADTVEGLVRFPELTARALFHKALEHPPIWLGAAMILRNMLVLPFRLNRRLPGDGHFLERMPIVVDEPDHFETEIEDRHLTFTLTVRLRRPRVFVTTSIWFNSWIGRVYLRVVMPGHILATRQITSRIAGPVRRQAGDPFLGECP